MCASPDALKSSRTVSSSRSSWPRTIPRRSAASPSGSPRASPASARRRIASTNPASPPRRRPVAAELGDLDRGVRAAAVLVGVEQAERRDLTADRDHLPHLRPRAGVGGRADPQHRDLARGRAVDQPRARDRRPDRALADRLQHDRARGDRAAVHARQRTAVERGEPEVRDQRAGEDRRGGDEREQRLRAGRTQGPDRAARRRRAPIRDRGGRPAGGEDRCGGRDRGGDRCGAATAGRRAGRPSWRRGGRGAGGRRPLPARWRRAPHTRTCSRSEASRTSPIPGT